MSVVTLILPKNMASLEKKYAEVVANIVAERLTTEELDYLVSEIEKKEAKEKIS